MNHGHIVTTTMRSTAKAKAIAPTRKRNQRLLIAAAGVFIATVVYIARPAHGDALQPVAYVAAAMMNIKIEVTVLPDASSMTATPATATPQPQGVQ